MSSNHRNAKTIGLAAIAMFAGARGCTEALTAMLERAPAVEAESASQLALGADLATPGLVDDVAVSSAEGVAPPFVPRFPPANASPTAAADGTLRLAREVITDSTAYHRNALLAKLELLAAGDRQLLPDTMATLAGRLTERMTVARHIPVTTVHGPIEGLRDAAVLDVPTATIATRDIVQSTPRVTGYAAGDSTGHLLHLDPHLRIAQEGLLLDPGGFIARWELSRQLTVRGLHFVRAEPGALRVLNGLSERAALGGAGDLIQSRGSVIANDDGRPYRAP